MDAHPDHPGQRSAPTGVLGPAAVRWNDYVGTAAADDADALLGRRRGEIPVVAFSLPRQQVEEFLTNAFKQNPLRLVARGVREHQLVVTPAAG